MADDFRSFALFRDLGAETLGNLAAACSVRDYGPGLSHDDMFRVFTRYGRSTKRDSNEVVGMLGIGSKSGFAYADTFTVVSRHGGRVRTYVAALDESEIGRAHV